jgi:hypothetical protein
MEQEGPLIVKEMREQRYDVLFTIVENPSLIVTLKTSHLVTLSRIILHLKAPPHLVSLPLLGHVDLLEILRILISQFEVDILHRLLNPLFAT